MRILVAAVSARALAQSLVAAGHEVVALDCFGDQDLRRLVLGWHRLVVADAAEQLTRLACATGCDGVLWGAPLENVPEALAALDAVGQNLGSTAQAVGRLRDWAALGPQLRQAGLAVPAWRYCPPPPGTAKRWLIKPRASGGGLRVRFWSGKLRDDPRHWYWQEFVPGKPASVLFAVGEGSWQLLWFGRQVIRGGRRQPFLFVGADGPERASAEETADIRRLGELLASVPGLRGLVGVDVIRFRGRLWPVEVNPRWTATVELAERLWGTSLALSPAQATGGERGDGPLWEQVSRCRRVWGKRIVYAERACRLVCGARKAMERQFGSAGATVEFADLPRAGTRFTAGEPIVTLLASGPDRRSLSVAFADAQAWLSAWLDT